MLVGVLPLAGRLATPSPLLAPASFDPGGGGDLAFTRVASCGNGAMAVGEVGVPTSSAGACPTGTVSGLAAKHDITVLNAPGVLDVGYTGSVDVLLLNLGSVTYRVKRGDRIAQLVVVPVATCRFYDVGDATLDGATSMGVGDVGGLRGDGGFGSSDAIETEKTRQ